MTVIAEPHAAPRAEPQIVSPPGGGFFRCTFAMILKEFLQLRRDRITFATMIFIPLMQLLLFGYAINTVPRDMPTAVLLQENSDVGRSIPRRVAQHQIFQAGARAQG